MLRSKRFSHCWMSDGYECNVIRSHITWHGWMKQKKNTLERWGMSFELRLVLLLLGLLRDLHTFWLQESQRPRTAGTFSTKAHKPILPSKAALAAGL